MAVLSLYVLALSIWYWTTFFSVLGKYRFSLIDVVGVSAYYITNLQSSLGTVNEFVGVFKTGGYYGVINELDSGKQGAVKIYFSGLFSVLVLWFTMYFCCVSTVLLIEFHRESGINGTYMNQLSGTISSVFTGLLDYATDVLLIFYWINSQLYVFVIIEVFFIVFGQVMASKFIENVAEYSCALGTTDVVSNQNIKRVNHRCRLECKQISLLDIVTKLIFALGFSRIYHSVKSWNDNKYLEYEYKWCKLWEIMYESIPSVILSTYITLVKLATDNYSGGVGAVIVSMFFSFVSITNTIVTILNKDRICAPDGNPDQIRHKNINEKLLEQVIADGESKNMHHSNYNAKISQDIEIVEQIRDDTELWVKDESTGEVCFFCEKPKPKAQFSRNRESCESKCNSLLMFTLHFDIKIKNFMIWLFLTTHLFLKTVSIIGNIVFVHFFFVQNTSTEIINFKNINNDQIFLNILSYIVNIIIIALLIKFERGLFQFMIECDDKSINDRNAQLFVSKYYYIGIWSNVFYFLCAIGLKYVPKLIAHDKFVQNQRFRI